MSEAAALSGKRPLQKGIVDVNGTHEVGTMGLADRPED
jgi:hypothetical protein